MSSQNTLVTCADDSEVVRPKGAKVSRQIYRDKAEQGSGTYKAMDENGNIEIIGGPGSAKLPFVEYDNNNTNIPANDTQTQIPLSVGIIQNGSTINNLVGDAYKIPKKGVYSVCMTTQQADNQANVAFIDLVIKKNGTMILNSEVGIDLAASGLAGSVIFQQVLQKDDLLTFFMNNNKDNLTTTFNFQTCITLLNEIE